ncbi:MAG: hypothetical protein Q4B60_05290 [Erysipelotrichaceae bacterium]|nr:hypothetical protein [Erysipelotrichaceae bacterium]
MNYLFDVPPRLVKKKGVFGQLENTDIIAVSLLGIIGFLSAVIIPGLWGISILGISILTAWILFIQPMKYGDNARVWIKRMRKYSKSQKLYYFYRGTR